MRPRAAEATAAAVAAAGGLAAAGVAGVKRRAARRRRAERAFRLRRDEPVAADLRRIARGRLDMALEVIADPADDKLPEAVHSVRKTLKRVRATVRVARPALGADTARAENAAYRDAARRLGDARDRKVVVDALDAVLGRVAGELRVERYTPLRERLVAEERAAAEGLARDAERGALGEVAVELERGRDRVAAWPLDGDVVADLRAGLDRIYRRGRRAYGVAREDPTAETLHELRKRAKDLWYAAGLLQPAAPKRLRRVRKRAKRLSELLGEDHDLAILRAAVETRRPLFADLADRDALVGVIRRRRRGLRRDALALAGKLYGERPRRAAKRLGAGWRRRLGPVAA